MFFLISFLVICVETGLTAQVLSAFKGLCCFFDSVIFSLTGTVHVSAGKSLGTLESPLPAGTSAIHMSLLDMRRNVAELRLQLQQMRQLQVLLPDMSLISVALHLTFLSPPH